jgi:lysozyme family protein
MTLETLYADFFRREGWPQVTDRPSDRGGLTKGGITFVNYNAWRAQQGLAPLTGAQFTDLTQPDALRFLADAFVKPLAFLDDEPVQLLLVDFAMNAGPANAITILQGSLKAIGVYGGATDGVAGPRTQSAWQALSDGLRRGLYTAMLTAIIKRDVRIALDSEARAFLATHKTTQLHNLAGWLNRRLEFLT